MRKSNQKITPKAIQVANERIEQIKHLLDQILDKILKGELAWIRMKYSRMLGV
ncbi:hypothetical protein [Petroclostridium xylanilyticum]|uniref:hypothetical protein n=1 Tax=Petroclostridium xylanilyticum TaxID=1792311 RepID=UPI0018E3D045|nr:hypothetical protein [Petroclostridium xylanilyticum]